MANSNTTLHVEVLLKSGARSAADLEEIRTTVLKCLADRYVSVKIGEIISGYQSSDQARNIESVVVADHVGPQVLTHFPLADSQKVLHTYTLHTEQDVISRQRGVALDHREDGESVQTRVLQLPNIMLAMEWDSLVFDDALPARLLRMLARMLEIMKRPGLNSSTFNWNRLCLFHGPPGSGKSTLCRALAQKLSIRLGQSFPDTILFEVNCNAMLSRYFGQSGKLIDSLFRRILATSQSPRTLVCVIMDEVETIAGHRENHSDIVDCRDGLRATNQLLTALDRCRAYPNIVVFCTSNLVSQLDHAFLDRIDKKVLVPNLSPSATYSIFQSCLNELIDNDVISALTTEETVFGTCRIPSFDEMTFLCEDATLPGPRLWELAQKCQGFSGRELRRLPIIALAEYTWDQCSLSEAVTALGIAIDKEALSSTTLSTRESAR